MPAGVGRSRMVDGLLGRALDAFGVVVEGGDRQAGSRSGAWVGAVRTAGGAGAYLKVMPAAAGAQPFEDTRRELRFYRELAPVVPLRVPRLLDGWEDEEGVALLLATAGAPRAATSWTPATWATLGRNLAALHAMPPPDPERWRRDDPLPGAMAAPNLPEIEEFWAGELPELPALLAGTAEFRRRMAALPPVFAHGDCHTDNIVHEGSSLVLCDWQTAGVGRPTADLAFLSVRATPSGTVVPRALIDAYLAHRPRAEGAETTGGDADGDRAVWERALVAEELATFVYLWPPFAGFNGAEAVARVRRRTRALAARFLAPNG